jgi:hypothetical protein
MFRCAFLTLVRAAGEAGDDGYELGGVDGFSKMELEAGAQLARSAPRLDQRKDDLRENKEIDQTNHKTTKHSLHRFLFCVLCASLWQN